MKISRFHTILAPAIAVILVVSAMKFYVVRELMAALVIFAVLFSVAATALLVMAGIEESIFTGITLLEARVRVRARNRER